MSNTRSASLPPNQGDPRCVPDPNTSDSGFDRCVLCGAVTEFRTSDPTEDRYGYIVGTGQLCRRCDLDLDRYCC